MFESLNNKLEGWALFMGSAEPLKNEMILLVDLQNKLHKVDDIGIAEMNFVFCIGWLLLRNIALCIL